jgi:hypothetical protein
MEGSFLNVSEMSIIPSLLLYFHCTVLSPGSNLGSGVMARVYLGSTAISGELLGLLVNPRRVLNSSPAFFKHKALVSFIIHDCIVIADQ